MKKMIMFAMCVVLLVTGTLHAQTDEPKKLKIFILAGQSNMEGKGSVYTMTHQLTVPEKKDRFDELQKDGQWVERDDVFIHYLGGRGRKTGKLTIGYGVSNANNNDWFGPELGFGWVVGDAMDQDILIIKTAWGGKSIDRDFRPPSRGYPDTLQQVFENAKKGAERRGNTLTLDQYKEGYGHFYRQMIDEVKTVTADLENYAPNYKGQGYELAGFVWFQGWNDQYAPTSVEDYEDNMAAFIKDVRKDLNAPSMPFVIGAMGHNGEKQSGKIKQIADAQAAVAQRDEFKNSVVTVRTAKYWDTEAEEAYDKYWADAKTRNVDKWREFGNDRGYHYLGSPVFFYNTGKAFGEEMLKLVK